jgi:hypothetical protein
MSRLAFVMEQRGESSVVSESVVCCATGTSCRQHRHDWREHNLVSVCLSIRLDLVSIEFAMPIVVCDTSIQILARDASHAEK